MAIVLSPVSYSGQEEMDQQEFPGGKNLEEARKAAHTLLPQIGAFTIWVIDGEYREVHSTPKWNECETCLHTAKYMPCTKFEMHHFNGPDEMHRIALTVLGIGLSWHSEGDATNDPEHYTESFDVIDRHDPRNDQTGISRSACEELIYSLYCDEIYK